MFRNKEFKYFSFIFFIISFVNIIISSFIGKNTLILSIITIISLYTSIYIFNKYKYNKISQLSDEIRKVLYDEDYFFINDFKEGELSILSNDIKKMTNRINNKNINIILNISENINIYGDFKWLSEAIQNILKNSIEKLNPNGIITIDSKENPLFTEIIIKDNGKGFNKKDLHNVFNKFYRGNTSNSSGYGIGLPLSKSIIEKHNGVISIKNNSKGGAAFIIYFSK